MLGKEKNHRMVGFLLRNRLVTILNAILINGTTDTRKLKLTEGHFSVTLNSKRVKLIRDERMNNIIEEVNQNNMEDANIGVGENAVVDLSEYIDRSTLTVQVGFPMSKVYTLFLALGLRHLCVVNEDGAPVGILTRKELMCAFDRDLM